MLVFFNACEANFAQLQFPGSQRSAVPVLPKGTSENTLFTLVNFSLQRGWEFTLLGSISVHWSLEEPLPPGLLPRTLGLGESS